jgi:hypothetical protein
LKILPTCVLFLALCGCDDSSLVTQTIVGETLPPIADVSRVGVRVRGSLEQEITSPAKIEELLQFVNSYDAEWRVPFAGPPVGQIYFDFYDGEKFVGNFYVGPSFFGRDYGNFFSQTVTDEEIGELQEIVGFPLLD